MCKSCRVPICLRWRKTPRLSPLIATGYWQHVVGGLQINPYLVTSNVILKDQIQMSNRKDETRKMKNENMIVTVVCMVILFVFELNYFLRRKGYKQWNLSCYVAKLCPHGFLWGFRIRSSWNLSDFDNYVSENNVSGRAGKTPRLWRRWRWAYGWGPQGSFTKGAPGKPSPTWRPSSTKRPPSVTSYASWQSTPWLFWVIDNLDIFRRKLLRLSPSGRPCKRWNGEGESAWGGEDVLQRQHGDGQRAAGDRSGGSVRLPRGGNHRAGGSSTHPWRSLLACKFCQRGLRSTFHISSSGLCQSCGGVCRACLRIRNPFCRPCSCLQFWIQVATIVPTTYIH